MLGVENWGENSAGSRTSARRGLRTFSVGSLLRFQGILRVRGEGSKGEREGKYNGRTGDEGHRRSVRRLARNDGRLKGLLGAATAMITLMAVPRHGVNLLMETTRWTLGKFDRNEQGLLIDPVTLPIESSRSAVSVDGRGVAIQVTNRS